MYGQPYTARPEPPAAADACTSGTKARREGASGVLIRPERGGGRTPVPGAGSGSLRRRTLPEGIGGKPVTKSTKTLPCVEISFLNYP